MCDRARCAMLDVSRSLEVVMGFGAVLRGFRAATSMTQEELADQAGLSVRAVRNLERGRTTRPHRESVIALAVALRLTHTDRAALLAAAGRAPAGMSRCELPPDVPDLVGRDNEVETLARLLTAPVPRLAVIGGGPGTGRTAVAVHVSHRVRNRFPDGQIFADLDPGDGLPLSANEVLARVLRSLSITDVPPTHDERAALVRAELGLRRVLVVLDNVAAEAQVRPLLTGAGPSAVLVTSRRTLVALPGAHQVTLGPLDAADAVRVFGHPGAAAARAVVDACGRLPVAVRIAAEWLATHPHRTAGDLAALLADDPLAHLTVADLSMRDTIAAHVAGLRPDDRHLLTALAEHDGFHTPDPAQHDGLARLAHAHLLTADRRPDPLVSHYVRARADRPLLRAAT